MRILVEILKELFPHRVLQWIDDSVLLAENFEELFDLTELFLQRVIA